MPKTNSRTNSKDDKKFQKKSAPNRKGGRYSSKKKDYEEKEVGSRSASSMNDITWYALSEQLLRDTASMPYSWATGLKLAAEHPAVDYGDSSERCIPGLFQASVVLDPFTSNDASDPVNVAARQIVGYIRSFNSGAKNYDAPDLMIRLLAEGEFLSQLSWAIRIFATVNSYSAFNRYMPKDLLALQHVQFDSIRNNLADFRAALNTIITKAARTLFIPANLPIYKRWTWLFSNYYCDSSNPKDQLYMLTPRGYHFFELDSTTHLGSITYKAWTDEEYVYENSRRLLTWKGVINGLERMLDPLFEDQDLCYMTGDMAKAYGSSAMTLSLVPDNLEIAPVDDPITLLQIKNSRTEIPAQVATGGRDIIQDNEGKLLRSRQFTKTVPLGIVLTQDNNVQYGPSSEYDDLGRTISRIYYSDHFLDTFNTAPTAVDNMENTRLTYMATGLVEGENEITVNVTSGSEKILFYETCTRQWEESSNAYVATFKYFTTTQVCPVLTGGQSVKSVSGMQPAYVWVDTALRETMFHVQESIVFDYMPNIYRVFVTFDDTQHEYKTEIEAAKPYMRLNNLGLLTGRMAEKMNNCALLSMFNIGGLQPSRSGR